MIRRYTLSVALSACAGVAVLLGVAPPAVSQPAAYPSKPIQLVVPFAAASGIDQLGRELGEALRTQMNTALVVENREGAGGLIGGTYVARSQPDGHTIMIAAHPPFGIAPLLQKDAGYDPLTSFAPVARLGAVPMVLVTAASTPFKTWAEMAAYFKANPDKANYAASGVGSPGQLYTQLIKMHTGLPLTEISYKSTAQALTDAIAGFVQISLVSYPAGLVHIKAGTLRLLAVGSPERLKAHPDVPTIAEVIGQPGFEASVWYGILAPAGTPLDRIDRLYSEITKAMATPRMTDFLGRSSISPQVQPAAAFATAIRNDVATAKKIIEFAQIKGM